MGFFLFLMSNKISFSNEIGMHVFNYYTSFVLKSFGVES